MCRGTNIISKIILVYGLSGSGKTTLARALSEATKIKLLNGDEIRGRYNDWDFSEKGRIRQATRMVNLSEFDDKIIIDMICPTDELRAIINPHISILMDTISECKFEDTNKIFTKGNPTLMINSFDYDINNIVSLLTKT